MTTNAGKARIQRRMEHRLRLGAEEGLLHVGAHQAGKAWNEKTTPAGTSPESLEHWFDFCEEIV